MTDQDRCVRLPGNPLDTVSLRPYVNFSERPLDPEDFDALIAPEVEEDPDEAYDRQRQEQIDDEREHGICTDRYELLDIQEEMRRE